MQRHPSLIPLSRDHHKSLILARLLQKDSPAYKGLPETLSGKAAYAIECFEQELIGHFETEEKTVIANVRGISAQLNELSDILIGEHRQLTGLFRAINRDAPSADLLDEIGNLLEQHIRKEEREFFPLIQESCDAATLAAIEKSWRN